MFLDVSLLECEIIEAFNLLHSSRDVLRNSLGIPVIRQRFWRLAPFPTQFDRTLFATSFTNFHLEYASPLFPGDENTVVLFVVSDAVHDVSDIALHFL